MLATLTLAAALAAPADASREIRTGLALLQEGKYQEAIDAFRRAQEAAPQDPVPAYNIACAYARMGEKEKAVEWLAKAVDLGYSDRAHAEADEDLDAIRGSEGYKKALERMDEVIRTRNAAVIERAKAELAKGYEKEEGLFPFDFSLTGIDGKPLALRELRGKVVLCDIWGTWCPPCRMYVPHLIELHRKYAEKGLVIVGLNYERPQGGQDAAALVKGFIERNGIPYRCAIGEQDLLKKVPGFRGFPTSLIIDGHGKVRMVEVGYQPYPVIEAIVLEALGRNRPRERF